MTKVIQREKESKKRELSTRMIIASKSSDVKYEVNYSIIYATIKA